MKTVLIHVGLSKLRSTIYTPSVIELLNNPLRMSEDRLIKTDSRHKWCGHHSKCLRRKWRYEFPKTLRSLAGTFIISCEWWKRKRNHWCQYSQELERFLLTACHRYMLGHLNGERRLNTCVVQALEAWIGTVTRGLLQCMILVRNSYSYLVRFRSSAMSISLVKSSWKYVPSTAVIVPCSEQGFDKIPPL